ncbi:hypothetical protein EWM64_g5314 [Hericium alpestre]|uniref:Anaphase-promoting complex subunit 4 WD40 domain-containing protein n=1 Tax=Hericium alpestre TaxID=135208 RepID=A0A4Y9ZYW5_9AGAM|nr:hypothetical protein EWM64_g5314 [Hericium alpestre]
MSFVKTALYPGNPGTARGVSTKLSSSKEKIVYTNGKSVYIRDINNPALSVAYTGHVQNTTVARISPTGYYCASADVAGNVRVWDTVGEDQALKGEYKAISGRVNDLEWDGDSKRIIAVGDGREKFGHAFMFDTGVPFKYDKTIKTHTRFVQDLRFAASGDHFASVGSDGKIFVYDGDVETRKSILTYSLGSGIASQQVGNVWNAPDTIVSLSMSGDLNVFDRRSGEKPVKVLLGPQKAVTAATSASSDTFTVGTADGRLLSYDDAGEASYIGGEGHTNLISALTSTAPNQVISAGFDDKVREIDGQSFTQAAFSTESQPRSIAATGDGTFFIAESSIVEAVRSNQKVAELKTGAAPSAVAAIGSLVAIGTEDQKVRLYDWDGSALTEVALLEGNKGVVSALAFSPDGSKLASGDSSGKIVLFDAKERKTITSRWSFHSARVNSIAWTADSQHCASGSLDTHVYVWSVQKPLRNIAIKNAVAGGVNAVLWRKTDDKKGTLVGAGADTSIRVWEITFHA